MLKSPKQFTASKVIFDVMTEAFETGKLQKADTLTDFFGRKIGRNFISVKLVHFSQEYFGGAKFFSKTIDGGFYIGCYEPKLADAQ